MKTKPVSPAAHGILDYVLVGSLLILPSLFGFKKKVKKIYTAEALILLPYVAVSDHPAALKPLIPFRTHGKIDPFNIAGFALQTFSKPFRKDTKAMVFNAGFTALAAIIVLLTDWDGETKKGLRSNNDTVDEKELPATI